MSSGTSVPAAAAMAICESLILSLIDNNILSEEEIAETLECAANAHHGTADESDDPAFHIAVAKLIRDIGEGRDSVRLLRQGRSRRSA